MGGGGSFGDRDAGDGSLSEFHRGAMRSGFRNAASTAEVLGAASRYYARPTGADGEVFAVTLGTARGGGFLFGGLGFFDDFGLDAGLGCGHRLGVAHGFVNCQDLAESGNGTI